MLRALGQFSCLSMYWLSPSNTNDLRNTSANYLLIVAVTSVCHHKNHRNLPKKGSPEGIQSTAKHRGGLNIGATHISSLPEYFFTISHEGDNTVLLSNLFQHFIFKAIRKLFLAHGVWVTACILAWDRFGWQGSMCMGVAFSSMKYSGCCCCNLGSCPKIFLVGNTSVSSVKFYSVTDCVFVQSKSLGTNFITPHTATFLLYFRPEWGKKNPLMTFLFIQCHYSLFFNRKFTNIPRTQTKIVLNKIKQKIVQIKTLLKA